MNLDVNSAIGKTMLVVDWSLVISLGEYNILKAMANSVGRCFKLAGLTGRRKTLVKLRHPE